MYFECNLKLSSRYEKMCVGTETFFWVRGMCLLNVI